ncbi:MAG: hypothetical protein ABI155_05180 [Paralcaligenes sp.]
MAINSFSIKTKIGLGMLGCWAMVAGAQEVPYTVMVDDNGPSLSDLAPVRLYSVPNISVEPAQPLPPVGASGDVAPAAVVVAAPEPDSAPAPELTLDLEGAWRKHMPMYAPGAWQPMGVNVLTKDGRVDQTGDEHWTLGTHNWRYTRANGTNLTLGNDLAGAPQWSDSARLGGVQYSHQLSTENAAADQWQYSTMVGALDYSPSTTEGGLMYGPAASSSVLRYGWSPQFTLESQLELAPAMDTLGLGGAYDTRGWGVWKAGVAQASRDMQRGWRYQVGYEANVLDTLKLSWVNAQRSGGFADLNRYRDYSVDGGQASNRWVTTWPTGRWGDISGSYETVHTVSGPSKQYIGLGQQFWLSPHLKVALQADHERIGGDYNVGLHFSIPIN